MSGNQNNLIVIENGRLQSYALDDRPVWELGRAAGDHLPDIRLYAATVSRRHGKFQNMDGVWFYVDLKGKNGTVYNGKHIEPGLHGRIRPIVLHEGDTFVFGGGKREIINDRTVWAMYTQREYPGGWRVEDTRGMERLSVTDGTEETTLERPARGAVIRLQQGMAIYMGDVTWLTGSASVVSG